MEHKKLIVGALKHFIRYNKNRGEISIINNGVKQPITGLCSYVYIHSIRGENISFDEHSMQIRRKVKDEFDLLIKKYTKDSLWLNEKYKVTKRRLQVAQWIINKLQKELDKI
jgi:hypothetical protein